MECCIFPPLLGERGALLAQKSKKWDLRESLKAPTCSLEFKDSGVGSSCSEMFKVRDHLELAVRRGKEIQRVGAIVPLKEENWT